jgi:hypothetical protein
MRIRELIFQGIFDCESPVRLATAPGVDRMVLPRGLSAANVHALLIALFFPDHTPTDLQAELDAGINVKLAIVFEHRERVYRVLRRSDSASLRLQVQGESGFKAVAGGPAQTAKKLTAAAGLPSFETFAAINLWRFDDDEIFAVPGATAEADERTRQIIEKYKIALQAEALEDRIKALEADIEEQRSALGKGSKIEEKLERAREKLEKLRVTGLSEQDLALLKEKDERFAEFDHLLERLLREEEDERRDVDSKLPRRPWRIPAFWAGLAVGIASLAASIALAPPFRPVAALNVFGFGMVAWVLLKHFTDMERASVHQVRLESIKRRINQVRDDEVTFREKVNHMLIHARVDDEEQLFERVEKTAQLETIVARLEEKAVQMRRNPAHNAAKNRIDGLNAELEERLAERATLPSDVMSSFQMEEDLRILGLDPRTVLLDVPDDDAAPELPATTFGRLKFAAEQTSQWSGGKLEPRVRKMWGKICGHVLSDRFKGVDLTGGGELRIAEMSAEQLAMWRRTRSSEERIVGASLALALHVNAPERSAKFMETIWIRDPRDDFGVKAADALDDVFASAAKKSHIVLCG